MNDAVIETNLEQDAGFSAKTAVTKLVQNISFHSVVNNEFFDLWYGDCLSTKQIAVFARNYWEWAYQFPDAIALLLTISDDYIARAEYAKTLFSELGNGRAHKTHSCLFENFYDQLAAQVNPTNSLPLSQLRNALKPLPETLQLISWEKETYHTDRVVASGAQLAIEWQAYSMIRLLYEGARNYSSLWSSQDEFHEACEFFYVHIGEAEKQHKEESLTAAVQLVMNKADFAKLQMGFERHLELITNFWRALANQIKKE